MSISVGWYRNTFKSCFCHLPLEMSNWIAMWFLYMSQSYRLWTSSYIPHSYYTVSTASTYYISEFVIIRNISNRWWWIQSKLRGVGTSHIPDVRMRFHFIWSLLEARDGIWNCKFVRSIYMPGYFTDTSLANIRWISMWLIIYLNSIMVLVEMFSTTWSDSSPWKYY